MACVFLMPGVSIFNFKGGEYEVKNNISRRI